MDKKGYIFWFGTIENAKGVIYHCYRSGLDKNEILIEKLIPKLQTVESMVVDIKVLKSLGFTTTEGELKSEETRY